MALVSVISCQEERDKAAAAALIQFLTQHGVDTFNAEQNMFPGQRPELVNDSALRESRYAFFIVSQKFMKTGGNHWRLLREAQDVMQFMPLHSIFIIPVVIDPPGDWYYGSSAFGHIAPMNMSNCDFSDESVFQARFSQAVPAPVSQKLLT